MISVALARECFYLPEGSSVPHWRKRPVAHFKRPGACADFNARFAGRPAGTTARADGRRRVVFMVANRRHTVYGYHVVWMLLKGAVPAGGLDHRNVDCTDDSIDNLREATQSQNNANTRAPSHNTSGVKGVSWHEGRQRFRAYIKVNGRMRSLGSFLTLEEAAATRQAAAIATFGEFARAA